MKLLNLIHKKRISKWKFVIGAANLFVICLLILLPYYLFDGRLFLGGDDTRLHYIYPIEFIKNLSFFSWVNISSLPSYLPNHHSIPFFLVLAILDGLLNSKIHLFYLAFSTPFVLGFIYFQKFVGLFIDRDFGISFITSLIYILSPITVVSQMSNFLFSMYLVALVPIIAYYYTSYLKKGKNMDLCKAVFWSIVLSIAFFAIQWILALLLPLFIGFILLVFIDKSIIREIRRTMVFLYFIISSQLFWLIAFIASLTYRGENDLGRKVISESFINNFVTTVVSTATGNILYPLLTFYHRQIAFDYDWQLKNVFIIYFDIIMPFSFIFILILFLGFLRYGKVLDPNKKKIFIFLFGSFIAALYFSTVNIGFLKEFFLLLGNIPGFAIFRNFTDKFALGFIFIYSALLALCLFVIKKSNKFYPIILICAAVVVFINLIPVKKIVASPLWKTKNVFTTVNLSNEYLSFVRKVRLIIPTDTNVIAFPQNISSYAIITEDNGKNAYIGTSPFKFFSGINDLSGSYSYPSWISNEIRRLIIEKDYENLLKLLYQINVGYMMVTNNISKEVLSSYLYEKEYLKFQDKKLVESIADHEVLRSDKGNYIIYKLKNSPAVISSSARVRYKKNSQINYEITIKGLKGKEWLFFHETYHPGWKLYVAQKNDFLLPLKMSIFDNSHRSLFPYGNEWTISSSEIINKFDKSYYKENKDGSVDVKLMLYFFPQIYFYIGIMMSVTFLSVGGYFLLKKLKNETHKKNN